MKTLIKILIILGVATVGMSLLGEFSVSRETYVRAQEVKIVTHAQSVWISALEWCESKAKPEAINPKDNDGTPSYYSFQFKPGTFKYFGEKYGVFEKGMDDETIMAKMESQETQQTILENMVADAENIKWEKTFPDCVKHKIGRPPVY